MGWSVSRDASTESQGLGSEGQLERLLSELPKCKEALIVPWSSSFNEDAS